MTIRPRSFGSTVWASFLTLHTGALSWGFDETTHRHIADATIDNLNILFAERANDSLQVRQWISDTSAVDVTEFLSQGWPAGHRMPLTSMDKLRGVLTDLHLSVDFGGPNYRVNDVPFRLDHVPAQSPFLLDDRAVLWEEWARLWDAVRAPGFTFSVEDAHPIDRFQGLLAIQVPRAAQFPKHVVALLLEEWVRTHSDEPGDAGVSVRLPKVGDRLRITQDNVAHTGWRVGDIVTVTDGATDESDSFRAKRADGQPTMFLNVNRHGSGWEFESAPPTPDLVPEEEVRRRIATAVAFAEARVRAAWKEDVVSISDRLRREAENRRWCSEYDEIVESLNEELEVPLRSRRQRYEVEYEGTITIPYRYTDTVMATSAENAWGESNYPTLMQIAEAYGGYEALVLLGSGGTRGHRETLIEDD